MNLESLSIQSNITTAQIIEKDINRKIIFNDISTADSIIIMQTGQVIFVHKSVLESNPFFAACGNFIEAERGIINIELPDAQLGSFCVEFIYNCSSRSDIQRVVSPKLVGFYDSIIENNFLSVFLNSDYLQISPLLNECYKRFSKVWKTVIKDSKFSNSVIVISELELLVGSTTNLNAFEKLQVICEWGKGLEWNYDRTQLHQLVSKVAASSIFGLCPSLTVDSVYKLTEEFKGTFDVVIPSSLLFKIVHKFVKSITPKVEFNFSKK